MCDLRWCSHLWQRLVFLDAGVAHLFSSGCCQQLLGLVPPCRGPPSTLAGRSFAYGHIDWWHLRYWGAYGCRCIPPLGTHISSRPSRAARLKPVGLVMAGSGPPIEGHFPPSGAPLVFNWRQDYFRAGCLVTCGHLRQWLLLLLLLDAFAPYHLVLRPSPVVPTEGLPGPQPHCASSTGLHAASSRRATCLHLER